MGKYEITSLLDSCVTEYCEREYIYEKINGIFVGTTFGRFVNNVKAFAQYLLEAGLYGAKIILYGKNSCAYMTADIAVMGYVGTCVTVSKEWKIKDIAEAVRVTDAKAFVYDREKEAVADELKKLFPDINIISLDIIGTLSHTGAHLSPRGTSECAKIIFSSGTTGVPKAVMLSQDNMFANLDHLLARAPFASDDVCYLFLPLSHTYGGICNFLYSLVSRLRIYLCSDTKKIFEEIGEVKPTFFSAVPLIYEKMYAYCISQDISPAELLGGNIRYMFSGGAFFDPKIRKYLKDHGLNLMEAYGLSETSSLVSCEYPNSDDFESVGTVFEGMEIAVKNKDENGIGEIYVKGRNVFSGYFGSARAYFDETGFFRTGDTGYMKNGKLYITGRATRMILFSNGENVYPESIERMFDGYGGISKVKVYEKDNIIFADIYTVDPTLDFDGIVAKINSQNPKYASIAAFEVHTDSIEARIK